MPIHLRGATAARFPTVPSAHCPAQWSACCSLSAQLLRMCVQWRSRGAGAGAAASLHPAAARPAERLQRGSVGAECCALGCTAGAAGLSWRAKHAQHARAGGSCALAALVRRALPAALPAAQAPHSEPASMPSGLACVRRYERGHHIAPHDDRAYTPVRMDTGGRHHQWSHPPGAAAGSPRLVPGCECIPAACCTQAGSAPQRSAAAAVGVAGTRRL